MTEENRNGTAEIINKRIAALYEEIQQMAKTVCDTGIGNQYYKRMMVEKMGDAQKEADISRKVMEELGLYKDLRELEEYPSWIEQDI